MNADVLRRAADLLDALVAECSPGQWSAGHVTDGTFFGQYGSYGWYVSGPSGTAEFEDSERGLADARLVAAMGPVTAQALADLFRQMAGFGASNPLPESRGSLVAVARAVLGEDPS